MIGVAAQLDGLVVRIDNQFLASGNAAGTHAARNDRRVRGHAAAGCQDTLSGLHAFDILRRSLETDKNNLLALRSPFLGILRREDDLAACSARSSRKALADQFCLLQSFLIKGSVKQCIEVSRVNCKNSCLLVDLALFDEVICDLQSSASCSLAVTCLQHIQLAMLDGELHILHVMIVILQLLRDRGQLLVDVRKRLLDLIDLHRRTDTGDHVFALRVHQNLSVELILTGSRVSRERNAGTGIIAHVAECHHLDVDSRAPGIRDVVVAAIDVRARVVPGTEYGLDRLDQLYLRIGREVLSDGLLVHRLELIRQILEILRGQIHVLRHAPLDLLLVDQLLKLALRDFHDDIGEHLDEPSVAVPCPARISGLCAQGLDDIFIKTKVEDRVHHARHGSSRARTNGNKKRILLITEFLARDLLELSHILGNLRGDLVVDDLPVLVVLRACFRCDREALRNRKTQVGHLGQVRTLTAEELAHVGIALGEQIHPFPCH